VNFGNAFEAATDGAVKATVQPCKGYINQTDSSQLVSYWAGHMYYGRFVSFCAK